MTIGTYSVDRGGAVPGTLAADGDINAPGAFRLLREGGLALVALFVLTAIPTGTLDLSRNVRLAIVVEGFLVVLLGLVVAKTLAGRVFLALTYSVFFEDNFFLPPTVGFVLVQPSVLLMCLALVLDLSRRGPVAARGGSEGLRLLFILGAIAFLFAVTVCAFQSPFGVLLALRGVTRLHLPMLLYACAGAMIFRKGESRLFIELVVFLAIVNAIVIWAYTLGGTRLLYYEETGTQEAIERFGGLLRNPNNSAFFCAFAVAGILATLRPLRSPYGVVQTVIVLFLIGTVVVLRTRGALLLLVLIGATWAFGKGMRFRAILFIVLGTIAYSIFGVYLSASQSDRAESLWERFEKMGDGVSTRLAIYSDTFRVFLEYPFGVGAVGGISELPGVQSTTLHESHNEFIGILVYNGLQTGLVVGAILILLLLVWGQCVVRRAPERPGKVLYYAFACFFITFSFEPIYNNSPEMAKLFGVVIGMLVSCLVYAAAPVRPQSGATQFVDRR